jgi:Flp pilus assembly protein TadD
MLIYLLLAALTLTGAWLAGPARSRMDGGTAAVVLLHLGLGVILAPILVWICFQARGMAVRRSGGSLSWVGWALVAAAFSTGVGLIGTAARGHGVSEALHWSHVAAGCGAAALGLVRFFRHAPDVEGRSIVSAPAARVAPMVLLLVLALVIGSAATSRNRAPETEYQPEEYYRRLTATNARQASNPLFPAESRVVADRGAATPSPAYCGTAGCHAELHREWLGSPHQRASLDPVYLEAAGRFAQQRGTSARRWCEGCHGPTGLVGVAQLDASRQGRRPGNPAVPRHAPGSWGVDCATCHSVPHVSDLSGNGRMELRFTSNYPFADHADVRLRWLHRFLLRVRPGPHRHAFSPTGLHARSEACAPCHRTSYNVPQNQYRFMRTADDYGTWQTSPYSGESVHSFSPPGPARQCQDCHDSHRGGMRLSTGTRTIDALSQGKAAPAVTVDLLALRRWPRPGAAAEELIAPLDRARPLLRPGETVTIDVVVSNRGVGHQFPAGTGDLTGAWLEFQVVDATGRTLLRSGGRRDIQAPEAGEHFYGLIALDRTGRRLTQGDLWQMVTPLFHRSILPGQPDGDRRTIQAGESDVVRFRLKVPANAAGPVKLQARLWRGRLVPASALTGTVAAPAQPLAQRLVAEDQVVLPVAVPVQTIRSPRPAAQRALSGELNRPRALDAPLSARFYEYGVGLLLQGDLPRAQRAMRRVQAWAPRDWRGFFGLGRVYLTEGDLLAARAQFERAAQLVPTDPRPRAFLAATLRRSGQYREALSLLEPLVRQYPRDRLLWFDLGMSHYLTGSYEEAIRAFEAVLAVDPDDLAAHFNRMRCLRRLRRVPEALQEEVIYEALREADAAKRVGLSFLDHNSWADRETRTIHEHPLLPVGSAGTERQ